MTEPSIIDGYLERRDASFLIRRLGEALLDEGRIDVRLEPLLVSGDSTVSINIVVGGLIAATIRKHAPTR